MSANVANRSAEPRAMIRQPHVWPHHLGTSAGPREIVAPRAPSNAQAVSGWDELYAARSEDSYFWDLARDSLEDCAGLRCQLEQGKDESWPGIEDPQQRLLKHVDAILCGGDQVVQRLCRPDAVDSGDAEAVFAAVFVLACWPSPEACRAIQELVRCAAESGADALAGAVHALRLAPREGALGAMQSFLLAPEDPLLAAALTVFAAHAEDARAAARLALSRDNPIVLAAAATAIGGIGEIEPLLELCRSAHENVARAAFRELTRNGVDARTSGLRALCSSGRAAWAECATWLGMLGHAGDVGLLRELIRAEPSSAVLRGAGCFGHADLLSELVDALETESRTEAAAALWRITGAPLTERVRLYEPDDEDPADPAADAAEKPAVREFENVLHEGELLVPVVPRKEPATIEVPAADPARWSTWLAQHRELATPMRWIVGRRYDGGALLDLLTFSPLGPADRAGWCTELGAAFGGGPSIDPQGWVVRQEQGLERWRQRIASTPSALGADGWRRG